MRLLSRSIVPLLLVLVFGLSQVRANTVPTRGKSGYGLGGPTEILSSTPFTLSDGTTLQGTSVCPSNGPDSAGNCDLMFIYEFKSVASTSETVNFTNLGTSYNGLTDFNGNPAYGILCNDNGSLPGISDCANPGMSGTANAGTGFVSFSFNNVSTGEAFFFIDSSLTNVCTPDPASGTCGSGVTWPVFAPSGQTVPTPEPSTSVLFALGIAVLAGISLLHKL